MLHAAFFGAIMIRKNEEEENRRLQAKFDKVGEQLRQERLEREKKDTPPTPPKAPWKDSPNLDFKQLYKNDEAAGYFFQRPDGNFDDDMALTVDEISRTVQKTSLYAPTSCKYEVEKHFQGKFHLGGTGYKWVEIEDNVHVPTRGFRVMVMRLGDPKRGSKKISYM